MTDTEKVKALQEQLDRIQRESEVERLQGEIRRLGFSPIVKAE